MLYAEKRKVEFIFAVKRFTTEAISRKNICAAKIFRESFIYRNSKVFAKAFYTTRTDKG